MTDAQGREFATFFPFIFIGMWLAITTILAVKARWFGLVREYPDRDEQPNLSLGFQSGSMSGVSMSGILRLEACPSGLRVGIWRMFGPFSRKFFVPWNEITVERKNRIFWKVAKLQFGNDVGNLTLVDNVANRLARSTASWPESGPFPAETAAEAFWSVFKVWFVGTALAATFFTVAPRLSSPDARAYPPVAVAILFPAIVFGVRALFSFFARIRN